MLAITGSRSSVFSVIVIGILVFNFFNAKPLRNYIVPIMIVIVFMAQMSVIMKTFREADLEKIQYTQSFNNLTELIIRLSPIRASIVTAGYFQDHDYWYGASFTSLLYAPIPRSMYPEKPPVETGRYTKNIALGEEVNPPTPDSQLPVYSALPEGNLIYYQNFGFLYFIVIFILGGFYSFFYRLVISTHSSFLLFFYLGFWGGGVTLGVGGIVNIIMIFLSFAIFYMVYKSISWIDRIRL